MEKKNKILIKTKWWEEGKRAKRMFEVGGAGDGFRFVKQKKNIYFPSISFVFFAFFALRSTRVTSLAFPTKGDERNRKKKKK